MGLLKVGLVPVRLTHAFLIVALLGATGTHWLVLQSMAWSGMLVHNLQEASFRDAIQRTFDGRHPCSLCKSIAKSQKSEKRSLIAVSLKQLEFVFERATFAVAPPADFELTPGPAFSWRGVMHKPPVPPPRFLLG